MPTPFALGDALRSFPCDRP